MVQVDQPENDKILQVCTCMNWTFKLNFISLQQVSLRLSSRMSSRMAQYGKFLLDCKDLVLNILILQMRYYKKLRLG